MTQTEPIMIVDDDPDVLVSLRALFEQHGFDVVTVASGYACIKELDQGFKGIIILDLMMPGMDGIETMRKMILDGLIQDNTIVVLTAKKIQDAQFDDYYEYIYDYIMKPFDVEYLLSVVNKIVNEHKMKKKISF